MNKFPKFSSQNLSIFRLKSLISNWNSKQDEIVLQTGRKITLI
eukprot:UN13685